MIKTAILNLNELPTEKELLLYKDDNYPDYSILKKGEEEFILQKENNSSGSEWKGTLFGTLDAAINAIEQEIIQNELAGKPTHIQIRTSKNIKQELQKKADQYTDGNLSQYMISSALGKIKPVMYSEYIGDLKEVEKRMADKIIEIHEENELLGISHNIIGDPDSGYRYTIIAIVKDLN